MEDYICRFGNVVVDLYRGIRSVELTFDSEKEADNNELLVKGEKLLLFRTL
jgi:hypothetical protein